MRRREQNARGGISRCDTAEKSMSVVGEADEGDVGEAVVLYEEESMEEGGVWWRTMGPIGKQL